MMARKFSSAFCRRLRTRPFSLCLAAQQGDRVGVLADADQLIAEVGFLLELLHVQADQPAAQQHGHDRPEGRVADRADEQPGSDRPQNAGESGQCDGGVDDNEDNGERVCGERLHVLGDALIGVVELPRGLDAVIGAVGQVAVGEMAGQPAAPAQAQHFLGEAQKRGHHAEMANTPA